MATETQPSTTPNGVDETPTKRSETPGARLAARKAAKAARKAAKRGRTAEQVEDEALKKAAVATEWAQTNRTRIMLGVGAVAILLVGIWAFLHHQASVASSASEALWQAVETAQAPIRSEGSEPADDDQQVFDDRASRDQAALEAFQAVMANHAGTDAAIWAHLGESSTLYAMGKWEEARGGFEAVIREAGDRDPAILWAALEGIAFTYEAEEKWDEAIAKLQELSRSGGGLYQDYADYHVARVQMAKGEDAAAKETLRGLVDRLKSPDNTEKVGELVALLSKAELRLGELDPSTLSRRGGMDFGGGQPQFPGASMVGGGTSEEVQRQIQELLRKMGTKAGPGALPGGDAPVPVPMPTPAPGEE